MPLVPWMDLDLESPMPPAAVAARLAAAVEPRRTFRAGPGRLPFEGEVTGDTFCIRRVIAYRNDWRPELRGALTPARDASDAGAGGTRVHVRLRLSGATAAFTAAWLPCVGLVALLVSRAEPMAGGSIESSALFPWAVLIGNYAIVIGAFSFEAWRSRVAFAALLRAPDAQGGGVRTGAPAA